MRSLPQNTRRRRRRWHAEVPRRPPRRWCVCARLPVSLVVDQFHCSRRRGRHVAGDAGEIRIRQRGGARPEADGEQAPREGRDIAQPGRGDRRHVGAYPVDLRPVRLAIGNVVEPGPARRIFRAVLRHVLHRGRRAAEGWRPRATINRSLMSGRQRTTAFPVRSMEATWLCAK